MLTRAEGRKQRREIERQIRADLKAKAKAKLRELRAAVKLARAGYGERVRAAKGACSRTAQLLTVRRRERKKRLFAELREIERAERKAARERCAAGKARAREAGAGELERARLLLEEERKYRDDLKRIERANRAHKWAHVLTRTAAERRSESDGEVEANIDAALVPLWHRVKARIRGSSRLSRTEAFVKYAEEHPGEVVDAQEGEVDATIRELERRQSMAEADVRRMSRAPWKAIRKRAVAEGIEVPF